MNSSNKKTTTQVNSFTRMSRKYSSYRGKVGRIGNNKINRRFKTEVIHQKITTDATEFKYFILDKTINYK